MSVLTTEVLNDSPLADLHALAGELAIDGFRLLRKPELIDSILASSKGGSGRNSGQRLRGGSRRTSEGGEIIVQPVRKRGEKVPAAGERSNERSASNESDHRDVIEGILECSGTGPGLVTTKDGQQVYVSANQIRTLDLKAGDRLAGPIKIGRKTDKYPGFAQIEVRGSTDRKTSANVVAETITATTKPTQAESLAIKLPTVSRPERLLVLQSDENSVQIINWLTPIGYGSRAGFVGPAGSGKSEALLAWAKAASDISDLQIFSALCSARPEEISEWEATGIRVTSKVENAGCERSAIAAVTEALQKASRAAARGRDCLLLIDSLDGCGKVAKSLTASAGVYSGGGSLTIVYTSRKSVGNESTLVKFSRKLAAQHKFPAIDVVGSWTLRVEELVGAEGAKQIAAAKV